MSPFVAFGLKSAFPSVAPFAFEQGHLPGLDICDGDKSFHVLGQLFFILSCYTLEAKVTHHCLSGQMWYYRKIWALCGNISWNLQIAFSHEISCIFFFFVVNCVSQQDYFPLTVIYSQLLQYIFNNDYGITLTALIDYTHTYTVYDLHLTFHFFPSVSVNESTARLYLYVLYVVERWKAYWGPYAAYLNSIRTCTESLGSVSTEILPLAWSFSLLSLSANHLKGKPNQGLCLSAWTERNEL